MSNFFKSLSRELGKNTGKYISNKVFGNNHATPYKIIRQEERNERRQEREKLKEEKNYLKAIELEEKRLLRDENRILKQKEIEERKEYAIEKKRLREEELKIKRAEIEARKLIAKDKKAQKDAEIEYNRWIKEQQRKEKLENEQESKLEKILNEVKNEKEVKSFNNYVSSFLNVHKQVSFEINWNNFICASENFVEVFKDQYLNNINKTFSTLTKEYAIMHLCWQMASIEYDLNAKTYVTKEEEKEWHNIIKQQKFKIDIDEFNKVLRISRDDSVKALDQKWLYDQCIEVLINQSLFWKLKTILLLKNIAWKTKESDSVISENERDFIKKVISSLKLPKNIYNAVFKGVKKLEPEIINLTCFGGLDFENLTMESLSESRPTLYDDKFKLEYAEIITSSQYELLKDGFNFEEEKQLYLDLYLLANKDSKDQLDFWNQEWSAAFKYTEQKAIMHYLAKGVLSKDKDVYRTVLEIFPIYDIISEYGSSLNTTFFDEGVEIDFFINTDDVVPKEKKSLSIKSDVIINPYTNTERNLIIQDYVCSMILRISRETLILFKFDNILVNAIQNKINSANGKYEDVTIVSVLINRNQLENINIEMIDPSDCLSQNFDCRMNFNKTNGFTPVKNIIFTTQSTLKNSSLKDDCNHKIKVLEKGQSKKTSTIIIKSNDTVSDLKRIIKSFYDTDVTILTIAGNIAGENRKIKALTDIEFIKPFKLQLKNLNFDDFKNQIKSEIGIIINKKL